MAPSVNRYAYNGPPLSATVAGTYGSAQSATFVVCKHGTALEVGTGARCEQCDDERWNDWFKHFMDRWEAKHGHRRVLHGYAEDELREAYEHRF